MVTTVCRNVGSLLPCSSPRVMWALFTSSPQTLPHLPYSLVSLKPTWFCDSCSLAVLKNNSCLFHMYVSITYALSHSSRIIKQGLEVQEWFWMVFKKNDLSLFFGSLSRLHQQRLNYDTGPHPPLYCPRTSLITFCCYNSSITSSNTTNMYLYYNLQLP